MTVKGGVKKILTKYELPDIDSIYEIGISKEQWKLKTKTAVKKYWSETLQLEAAKIQHFSIA